MKFLLYPPIAFLLYLALVGVIYLFGRILAGPEKASSAKPSTYASGEEAPGYPAAPGYRQFFVVALFFAVLHLGILMAGSSGLTWTTAAYLAGLILALIALILG